MPCTAGVGRTASLLTLAHYTHTPKRLQDEYGGPYVASTKTTLWDAEFGHSSGRHASHTYTHSLTYNPVRKRVSVLVLKMLMSHAQRVNIVVLKGLLSYCVLSRADIFGYFLAPKAMYVCSGQQCCTHLGHCHSHLVKLLRVGLKSVGAVDGRGTFVALFLMRGGKPCWWRPHTYVNMYSLDWGC